MSEIIVVASEILLRRNAELISSFNARGLRLMQIVFYPLDLNSIATFLRSAESNKGALIFTSQNAILAFNEALNNNLAFLYLKQVPCYIIGHSSAQLAHELGFNIAFIGKDGHGDSFGDEILPLLDDHRVVYCRAQEIASGLDRKLEASNIIFKEVVLYQTQALESSTLYPQKPKQDSIIIFTAPSHFKVFKEIFTWDLSYRAIAIGETTFKNFDASVMGYMSKKRDLHSCLELAQELQDTRC